MRTFAAEGNPELQRTQQELEALRRELARIEGSSSASAVGKGVASGSSSGLDNLGRLRDVKYYEFLYEMLAKQYELAKIDEAKDATIVQVMDKAIEPDRKSKPRRGLIVLLSTIAGFFIALFVVFLREALHKAHRNPSDNARLNMLKSYFPRRQIKETAN